MSNHGYNHDTYCTNAFGGFDSWAGAICCKIYPRQIGVPFKKIINSEVTRKIQHDLLRGIKNPLCNDCWEQEKRGVKSLRYWSTFQQLRNSNDQNVSLNDIIREEVNNKKIRNLVLNSGNVCNLACRTCHPNLSSGHWNESTYKNSLRKFPQIIFTPKINKTNLDLLLSEDYSNVQSVVVLGGEPFLNLDHLQILEKVVKDGNSHNCILSYLTNMTIRLPDKIKKITPHFKKLAITMSIDATNKQFNYIRTNGDWEVVLRNITDLLYQDIEKEENNNIDLNINIALSVLNLLYVNDVYELGEKIQKKIMRCNVQIQFVNDPDYYSANILQDNEKQIIIDYIKQSKFDLTPVVKYVEQSTYDSKIRERFYQEIEFTKKYKGLNIYEYLPELMNILG